MAQERIVIQNAYGEEARACEDGKLRCAEYGEMHEWGWNVLLVFRFIFRVILRMRKEKITRMVPCGWKLMW